VFFELGCDAAEIITAVIVVRLDVFLALDHKALRVDTLSLELIALYSFTFFAGRRIGQLHISITRYY
jgi:hypothetical protein